MLNNPTDADTQANKAEGTKRYKLSKGSWGNWWLTELIERIKCFDGNPVAVRLSKESSASQKCLLSLPCLSISDYFFSSSSMFSDHDTFFLFSFLPSIFCSLYFHPVKLAFCIIVFYYYFYLDHFVSFSIITEGKKLTLKEATTQLISFLICWFITLKD